MVFNAVIMEADEGGFVAFNPETGTTSQGESLSEAVANLREATELWIEEFSPPKPRNALLTTFELATANA